MKYFLLLLLVTTMTFGQMSSMKNYNHEIVDRLGIQGNLLLPVNEFDMDPGLKLSYIARLMYRHNLTKLFTLEVGAGYGKYTGFDDAKTSLKAISDNLYETTLVPVDGRFLVHPFDTETVMPYFYAGVGLTYYNVDDVPLESNADGVTGNDVAPFIPLGIGFEWRAAEQLFFDFSIGGAHSFTDNLNYNNKGSLTDAWLNAGLSIMYGLKPVDPDPDKDGLTTEYELQIGTDPYKADTDGDGLNDSLEVKVHNTNPSNVDTDGDTLSDYDEIKNHNTDPTKADTDGDMLNDNEELLTTKTDPLVKDSDKDGLEDGKEVNTHKTNPNKKDTDDDGLTDYDELMTHKTNPLLKDTDGDKLYDGEEIKEHKTNPLVVDTDGGSVNDYAEVQRGTDPTYAEDDVIKKDVAIVLEGITFESSKADIRPESEVKLQEALKTLRVYSDIVVEIGGHTDSQGSAASNQKLSQARAESVKNWLVSNGISADRIEAKGYGEVSPIADNNTPEGRAKNRRIEFRRIR